MGTQHHIKNAKRSANHIFVSLSNHSFVSHHGEKIRKHVANLKWHNISIKIN